MRMDIYLGDVDVWRCIVCLVYLVCLVRLVCPVSLVYLMCLAYLV